MIVQLLSVVQSVGVKLYEYESSVFHDLPRSATENNGKLYNYTENDFYREEMKHE